MAFTTKTVIGDYDSQALSPVAPLSLDLWILWGDVSGTLGDQDIAFSTSWIGGNDIITGANSVSRNSLFGDVQVIQGAGINDSIVATGGDDILYGGTNTGSKVYNTPDPWEYGNFLFGDAYSLSGGSTTSAALNYKAKGGNDTLRGGSNSQYEYLYGDAYEIWGQSDGVNQDDPLKKLKSYVTSGNDMLFGGANTLYSGLYGDGAVVTDVVRLGNDKLIGADGNQRQILVGDADTMGDSRFQGGTNLVQVIGGDDSIWGGKKISRQSPGASAKDVYLVGDGYTMNKGAEGGNDKLYSAGSHLWAGFAAAPPSEDYSGYVNWMFGDAFTASRDYLPGGDYLFSGPGTDYMWGDNYEGASKGRPDSYVFTSVNYTGEDQIVDFDFTRNARIATDTLVFTGEFWDASGLLDPTPSGRFNWLKSKITTEGAASSNTRFVFNAGTGGAKISSVFVFELPSNVLLTNTWDSFRALYPTAISFVDPSSGIFQPVAPPTV